MPCHVDILFERLKQFDEVTILELLDITAEELLEKFKERVLERKDTLFGEIELLTPEDDELPEDWDKDYKDGFEEFSPFEEDDLE